jgi:hypothetical protein
VDRFTAARRNSLPLPSIFIRQNAIKRCGANKSHRVHPTNEVFARSSKFNSRKPLRACQAAMLWHHSKGMMEGSKRPAPPSAAGHGAAGASSTVASIILCLAGQQSHISCSRNGIQQYLLLQRPGCDCARHHGQVAAERAA